MNPLRKATVVFLAALSILFAMPPTAAQDQDKGRLQIKLVPPPGVAKPGEVTMKVALSPLNSLPWKPACQFEVKGAGDTVSVKPGVYLVQSGQRNANGDVFLFLEVVEIKPGETATVEIQVGLPCEEGGRMPLAREVDRLPKGSLRGTDGKSHTLSKFLRRRPLLLVFFSLENEPCQRMLPDIVSMKEEIEEAGVRLVGVHVKGGAKVGKLKAACSEKGMALPLVLLDNRASWAKKLKLPLEDGTYQQIPAIIAVDKKKKIIFWTEGYDLNVKAKIRAVLKKLCK